MSRRTPLYDLHVAAGGRMVDFAGWEMPLNYGSQIAEHKAVRDHAGIFDVSHMTVIDVGGAGAFEFLREVVANDVGKLDAPGRALYGVLLNPDGGVIDDLIVYRRDDDYRCVVNAATRDKVLAWFGAQNRGRAEIAERDLAMIAVQGPSAREKFWRANPETCEASQRTPVFSAVMSAGWLIARTGYTGEDGFEITLPGTEAVALWERLLAVDVAPAGLGARDTLRLEAGMNLYGQDMDENVTPMESGLQWTVDLSTPREFIGRKAISASQPTSKLVGLVLRERGILRAHQKVQTRHGDGEITSGTFAPTLGVSIAFARLPDATQVGEDVSVEVRGRGLTARTVKYPFVRHGQNLIDNQLA